MTLPQIEAFINAVESERNAERRLQMYIARAAQAEKKHYEKAIKGFE